MLKWKRNIGSEILHGIRAIKAGKGKQIEMDPNLVPKKPMAVIRFVYEMIDARSPSRTRH